MADDQRLDGWKAIGNFLGRDRTTALRWAKERHLPVHRVPGGRTGTVYALRSELNEWLSSGDEGVAAQADGKPPRIAPERRSTLTIVVLFIVVAASVTGFAAWRSTPSDQNAVGIMVMNAPTGDRLGQQFANALTADLARFANTSAGLAVYETGSATHEKPQYAVRANVERDARGLAANARLISMSDGTIIWSHQTRQTAAGVVALRERVAANIVGILRCSFASLGKERAQIKLPELTLLAATCQAIFDADDGQAAARARELTVARPDLSIGWALLGETLALNAEETGDAVVLAQARKAVRRAEALAPNGLETFIASSMVVGGTGSDALPILERGLRVHPDAPSLLGSLSVRLFNLGYVHDSVDPVLQAIHSDPTWFGGRDLAVRRLAAAGRLDEAKKLQAENEHLWPGHPFIVRQRERLFADGEEMAGVELRAKIIAAEHDYKTAPELAYIIARLHERAGDHRTALAWLDRAPVAAAARQQWSLLFWPGAEGLRADPLFFRKMAQLGLVRWWVARKRWPDFCSQPGLRYDCQIEATKYGSGAPL